MRRLSRKGFKEASIILEIRGLGKLESNYLNVKKVDRDGRIRCSYNPVGTRYSRISSSENIFGTGTNMQNWPHEMLKYLLADDGYVGYFPDLNQAENRIAAYIGRVTQLIEAFERGDDVHRLTASLIFGVPYDEVSDEPGSCPISRGRFSQRHWGKKLNHALNYGLRYKGFALRYELPETEAKWLIERLHACYPGVRESYHSMIRDQLARDRTLTNLFGRKTRFFGKWDDNLFREAYSCIPQGTAGDKINEQGINYIYYNQDDFGPIELLIQIHDSIGFQIPLSFPWLDHARMLKKIKDSLETPLVWRDREFVVPVDLTIGKNLCKEEGVEIKSKDFPSSVEELAKRLEGSWTRL